VITAHDRRNRGNVIDMDAAFRDLCLDANDVSRVAGFWADVLGLEVVAHEDEEDVHLQNADGARSGLVWVNEVPEPRTVKSRVHLDLRLPVDDPAALIALGATRVRDPGEDRPWTVLADPEGNEFCAFGPGSWSPPEKPEPFELVVDSADPLAIASWWAERVGGTAVQDDKPWAYIEGAEGFPYRYWVFTPVPEPKSAKNRLHWDVHLTGPDPSAFVAAGARVLAEPSAAADWWVLADPEGNEFCAFNPAQA
jgi:catechol 2,3-dioxygenase-like lactoylglutathione lyase family enzyme